MADISSLHPMIQGFVQGMNIAREHGELVQRQKEAADRAQEVKDALAENIRQHNEEYKLRQAELKNTAEHTAALISQGRAQTEFNRIQGLRNMADWVAGGGDPNALGPQVRSGPIPGNFESGANLQTPAPMPSEYDVAGLQNTVPRDLSAYGLGNVAPSAFPSPERRGLAEGQVEGGKIAGMTPALLEQYGGKAAIDESNQEKIEKLKATLEQTQNRENNAAAYHRTIDAANIAANAHRYTADKNAETELGKFKELLPTEEDYRDIVLPGIAAGNITKEDIKSQYGKAAPLIYNNAVKAGIQPLSKEIATQKLPGLQVLSEIGKQAEQYTAALKAGNHIEASRIKAYMVARMGNISKMIGGESGRLSEPDIYRAVALFGNEGDFWLDPKLLDQKLGDYWRNYATKQGEFLNGAGRNQILTNQHKYGFVFAGPSKRLGRYTWTDKLPEGQ